MKLDKENTKQIIKIIFVAIILLTIFLNLAQVWNISKVFLNILSPFIWGFAIAFILNIFMTLYENKIFKLFKRKESVKNKKSSISKEVEKKRKLERVFSIALSMITIVAVITIILILIIPQFIDVVRNFIGNIPNYLENLQRFAIDVTDKVPEINSFIQNIQIDTEALKEGNNESIKRCFKYYN